MRNSIRTALVTVLLALGACGLLSDEDLETDPSGEVESVVPIIGSAPRAQAAADDGGRAPVPADADAPQAIDSPDPAAPAAVADGGSDTRTAAQTPADTTTPAATQIPEVLGLNQRLDRLLASQDAINRRLDSLAAGPARADTVRRLSDSGEVLGEAGQRARNFGVGFVWSLIVLIVFNVLIRSLVWLLDNLAERNASRRLFYKRLVPILRIMLWIFAAYLIVSVIFQVDAQGIFAAAAAIGVAVGFAAQDLLKNLFGGLILVFDQPFQVGDKISVGGTYGEVVSIGLRSTRLVTSDDNLVSVPNAQVVDQQVANANAGELHCQVVTDLYLPGWSDEAKAKQIALDAAASSKYVFLNKPIVALISDEFKETFLTRVRVKAYVLDPRLEFLFRSDVTERARAEFREAGLLTAANMRQDLVERSAVGHVNASDGPAGADE